MIPWNPDRSVRFINPFRDIRYIGVSGLSEDKSEFINNAINSIEKLREKLEEIDAKYSKLGIKEMADRVKNHIKILRNIYNMLRYGDGIFKCYKSTLTYHCILDISEFNHITVFVESNESLNNIPEMFKKEIINRFNAIVEDTIVMLERIFEELDKIIDLKRDIIMLSMQIEKLEDP